VSRRIKVISFDFDGTLVSHAFIDAFWNEEMPKAYAQEKGVDLEVAKAYMFAEYDRIGNLDLRWYLPSFWLKYFKLKITAEELLTRTRFKLRIYPDVHEALESLRKRFVLIIVSSAAREFIEFGIRKIGNFFHSVFSSVSDYGIIRKSADFYLIVCDKLGIKPFEMIHVGDDSVYDFYIPRRLGIKAFLIRRGKTAIGKFIIENLKELKNRLMR
jgi:putative hydrolase of the HAD superfamily